MFQTLDLLLEPNKIIPYYNDRFDAGNLISSPISAELHWTSNCNYDCIHCSYGSRRETTNYLREEVIGNLLNDLIEMKCEAVYMSGGGEPTVIKKWADYAEKLITHNIEVALITNGVAINEKHIDIVRKMNYIAVSVYSMREDRYKEITQSKSFLQQIKSISSDVIVGARCVINKINYDELYEIYSTAIASGFDYIIFIPVIDYEGRGVILEKQWIESVKNDINKRIAKFDHNRTNVKSLLKRKVSHYAVNNYCNDMSHKCESIHIASCVFFNYDGGVYLCQPDIGNKNFEIGNLNNDRFINIWNSQKHKQVIDVLDNRWANSNCKNCRSIAFNKAIYAHQECPVDMNSIPRDCFL